MNLAEIILKLNGNIIPLLLPSELYGGTGIMNPSVYIHKERLLCTIRNINYIFYHSEKQRTQHPHGMLTYVHPENDVTLTTHNFIIELDPITYEQIKIFKIDTSITQNYKPKWEFIGHEDVRLFSWEDQLYVCGIRRDLDKIGTSRMELCKLKEKESSFIEHSKFRIPVPNGDNSYCEKNWVPILDKPFNFIKWHNPMEIVEVDPIKKTSIIKKTGEIFKGLKYDLRGSSQVIKIDNYFYSLTHETHLGKTVEGYKNATYKHRLVQMDEDFNIIKTSKSFSLLGAQVEFVAGMTLNTKRNELLISFGFSDNSAFLFAASADKFLEEIFKI